VGSDLVGVIFEKAKTIGFVLGFDGAEIGFEGDFGIDHNEALIGETDDEIGALIGFTEESFLFGEITVFEHAGEFDNAAKLDFTPAAALDGRAEGGFELVGGLADAFLELGESLDLGSNFRIGAGASAFNGLHLFFKAAERLIDGFDEMLELVAAAVKKELAVVLQGVGSEGAKTFFDLLVRLGENAELGFGDFAMFGGFGFLLNDGVASLFEGGRMAVGLRAGFGGRLTPAAGFGKLIGGERNSKQQRQREKDREGAHFLNPVSVFHASSVL
jgi:hypothetical protein